MRRNNEYLSILSCIAFMKEARLTGLWINIKKDWYTPEEFSNYINKFTGEFSDIERNDLKLRDPRQIIPKMERYIEELANKKFNFEKKVNEYYKLKR